MGHHQTRRESLSAPNVATRPDHHHHHETLITDLSWPFNKLDGIDRDDVRETAYEIFFTACRSSPGFGGRNALTFYSSNNNNNNNNHENSGESSTTSSSSSLSSGTNKSFGVVMTPTSRIKRTLGLKMLKRSPSRRMSSGNGGGGAGGSNPPSPGAHGHGSNSNSPAYSFTVPIPVRARRPMTSAEIMRQQMRVTEQSDNRLRKTLMRTLVGQVRVSMINLIFLL
jgi:hypothetical protein